MTSAEKSNKVVTSCFNILASLDSPTKKAFDLVVELGDAPDTAVFTVLLRMLEMKNE